MKEQKNRGEADTDLELKIANAGRINWIIFGAFLTGSILNFVLFSRIASSTSATEGLENGQNTALIICILLSILFAGLKFWLQHNRLYKESAYAHCSNLDEVLKHYGKYFAFSLVLCFGVLTVGDTLFLLTHRWAPRFFFVLLSGVLYATSTPRLEKLRSIIDSCPARLSLPEETFVGELRGKDDLRGVADIDRTLIASLFRRSVALIIDVAIAYGLMFMLVAWMVGFKHILPEDASTTHTILSIVFFCIYLVLSVGFAGRTFGCLITRIKIVSADGLELTWRRSLMRGVLMTFTFFFWPLKIPLFLIAHIIQTIVTVYLGKNEFKQTEWDHLAKTVVVKSGK